MSLQLKWLEEYDSLFQSQEARHLLSNPLLHKDNWQTIEDLGLNIKEHQRIFTINFGQIEQNWSKLLSKLYILVRSSRKLSVNYLKTDVSSLNRFSQFLQQKSVFNPN